MCHGFDTRPFVWSFYGLVWFIEPYNKDTCVHSVRVPNQDLYCRP